MMGGRWRKNRLESVMLVVMAAPLLAALAGCAGMVIGAGATVATAAVDERGMTGAATDLAIASSITALWVKHDPGLVKDLDVTVSQGRALLTGTVATRKRRLEAVRLAWRASGVKAVLNEIQIHGSGGIGGYARDGWITTQIVSKLSFDRKVNHINYTVETVNRIVYLMGIAQDQAEIDRVAAHARHVRYVRRVVNHVRVKNDRRDKADRYSAPDTGRKR